MDYLIGLEDDLGLDPDVVGHKFASLARAARTGFVVPSAVAIRVEANEFYRRNKSWPEGLQEEITDAVEEMLLSEGVSARSSSTQEDLGDKSFAGQYETYLNIHNGDDLREKIEKCWQSAASQLVLDYLDHQAPAHEAPLMCVIIQRMVHAKAAGVAFSRNPLYPLKDEVVIEGVAGLGEKLVSGHVTPHRVFVRKGRIIKDGSTLKMEKSVGSILADTAWREIAALVRRDEAQSGGQPRDMEWAVDENGKLWLLQSRPITAIRAADLRAPSGTWTRKIAEDLWADRLTPLLADVMMKNASRFDLTANAKFLRMPVAAPTLSVIGGLLYVNCESLKQLLTLVPDQFRIHELRSLFPPGFEIDSVSSPNVKKLLSPVVRAILLGLMQPQGNPLFCRHLTRRNVLRLQNRLNSIEHLPDSTAEQALRKSSESLECLALLQENNQWPYLYATIFTWALRWAAINVCGLTYSDFLHLLKANTRNITTEIEHAVKQLVEMVQSDGTFLLKFVKTPEQFVGRLPDPIQKEFDRFLSRYGCRSRHRTLYLKRWAEAPEEVLKMMAALLRNPEDSTTTEKSRAVDPMGIIRQKLSLGPGLLVRSLTKFTCGFLNLREDLRFFLDKVLFQVRQSLLTLGKHCGLGENVLFLTQTELAQLVGGDTQFEKAESLAAERRRAFLEQSDVHPFYIDGRPVDELPSNTKVIRGIGTSPGRATGRARIVDDPAKHTLQKGDILVAKNTDPGWTPILRIVGGIVVEEGGILNHCSIVARELGIPAVVGVRQATRKIPENALITVDGGLGAVQMAEDA